MSPPPLPVVRAASGKRSSFRWFHLLAGLVVLAAAAAGAHIGAATVCRRFQRELPMARPAGSRPDRYRDQVCRSHPQLIRVDEGDMVRKAGQVLADGCAITEASLKAGRRPSRRPSVTEANANVAQAHPCRPGTFSRWSAPRAC